METIVIETEKMKFVGKFANDILAEQASEDVHGNPHHISTKEELATSFSGPELVRLYNGMINGGKPVKKFADKQTAIKRVWDIIQSQDVTTAESKPKKKVAKKKAGTGKPRVDYDHKSIKLLKGAKDKKFQEGSMRADCFAVIKDGMLVSTYLAKCEKKGYSRPQALGCLQKLAEPKQAHQAIELKEG